MNTDRIAPRLRRIKDLAQSIKLNALDLQDNARDLDSRPMWSDLIKEILIEVEEAVEGALDSIHEAQQRLDSMPVILSLRAAE